MALTDEILAAFRKALDQSLLGIEQVDAVLTEDGAQIVLYGRTADEDVTYTASFPLPVIEWRKA